MKDNRKVSNALFHKEKRTGLSVTQKFTIVCTVLVFLVMVSATHYPDILRSHTTLRGDIETKLDDIMTVPLMPEMETIEGVDHYYMLPDRKPPKAILIFLHSCRRSGLEFFHLPEDRVIAHDALQKGIAVFSPTSQHRESGCFTKMDVSWIGEVVEQWAKRHQLGKVPKIGMAVSSGASFLFFVYNALNLKSMAVYNTPQAFQQNDITLNNVIPTAYVTMSSDEVIANQMEENYKETIKAGVPSQIYRVTPHPFTEVSCMTRFPEMLPEDCKLLFDTIHEDYPQLLDSDGFVRQSFKSPLWEELFTKLELDAKRDEIHYLSDTATSGHSWTWAVVEQEVRASEAYHAMTAEHHSSVLDFLMQNARTGARRKRDD